MALPPLREELELLPGAPLADGQPGHTLHDPVRNLFFQIDWPAFEVLRRWELGDLGAIADAIAAETTLQLQPPDVEAVVQFLVENQLVQPAPGSAGQLADRLKRRRGTLAHRLLHNYLFFRIPLFRPDRWLGRWAPRLDFLYSARFLALTLAAFAWGLVEVYRQWDRFAATLVDTLSWSGFASYGAALVAVKTLHELGHAVTAKRYGCRVPTMGVAFLVLWPVAYTDTNEVWKLASHRQRLAVAGAGILTELAIAAWATLAWAVLPEGTPRSLAFLLATTTWVSSLAINASPFLRFDGYFLLMDALRMPNLHARAFALARWDLRERLFALGAAPPEVFAAPRRRGLILFAYATWIYRLVVFLGIAVLVYTFFIKAVGIFLFLVEIGWFVLLPLYRELVVWRELWPVLRERPRARRSAGVALALFVLLVLPWPLRIDTAGVIRPAQHWAFYAPPHAQVAALPATASARVEDGAMLMNLASPDLAGREAAARARLERARWQAGAGAFDSELRAQWQVLQEQLVAAEAEAAAVRADAARYAPAAPFEGVLRDVPPDLRPGEWTSNGELLGRVVGEGDYRVVAYLDEEDVGRVAVGDSARFYADAPGGPSVALEVADIDRDAARTLAEGELARLFGGSVSVREKNGILYPERPVFRITLRSASDVPELRQHAWRGKVVIAAAWAAPGWRYLKAAVALFWREAGF